MIRICLAILLTINYVSANLEIATIEKDVEVEKKTYTCTFRLVHDEEETTVDEVASAVTCTPKIPYSHIPVNDVVLESGQHTFMVDFQMNPDEIIQVEYEGLTPHEEFLAANTVEEEDDKHYGCDTYKPDNIYLTDNSTGDSSSSLPDFDEGTAAGAHVTDVPLWKNGIIPYKFDYNFNQQDRLAFAKATQMIEAGTCLKFQPHRGERQWLRVIRQCHCRGSCFGGGFASLGAASPAKLTIGAVCLTATSASGIKLVAHELLHSLGIHHTQVRPDRDSYISINWNNIQAQPKFNYQKCPTCRVHGTPYDCMSIMHYRDWAFAINNRQPTMWAKNSRTCDLRTPAYYLSAADKQIINAMYRCGSTKPVDGGWGGWSAWSTCSNGAQYKYRVCNNPKPSGGGKKCSGQDKITQACSGGKNWEKHTGKDCYEGKGGSPMDPDPYSNSLSLSQCQSACVRNSGCVGIVRKESDGVGTGICYLRKVISLGQCATDNEWSTYKVSDSTVIVTTAKPPIEITTTKKPIIPTDDFKKHSGTDCYQGMGGDPIQPDPFSNSVSLSECKAACKKNSQCQGIIRKASDQNGNGICYLRKNLKIQKCARDATWDLYQKGGGGSGDCKHTDKNKNCANWKDTYCTDSKWGSWMAENCAKSCKCDGGSGECKHTDKNKNCASWKDTYCTDSGVWGTWMAENCAKTCKCEGTTVVTPRPTPSGRYGCRSGIQAYPRNLPNSHYYRRICYTNKGSLKIISANYATAAAIERTAFLIDHVMDRVDPRVPQAMNRARFRHAVMGNYPRELTTHIPEHAWLGAWWNERARGLGATVSLPVGSSAEENAMCYSNDRYRGEDITIHEFAHSLHLTGFNLVYRNFDRELQGLYNAARYANIWPGHYAMTDHKEYFAEGVQSYFNANMAAAYAPTDRNQLYARDPNFYRFLDRYLGGNTWSRTCPQSG